MFALAVMGRMRFPSAAGHLSGELFNEEAEKSLGGVLFVGDDYLGWMFGYETSVQPCQMRLLDYREVMSVKPGELV